MSEQIKIASLECENSRLKELLNIKTCLRDQFAMAATEKDIDLIIPESTEGLECLVGNKVEDVGGVYDLLILARAKARYIHADAMLKAREEKEDE